MKIIKLLVIIQIIMLLVVPSSLARIGDSPGGSDIDSGLDGDHGEDPFSFEPDPIDFGTGSGTTAGTPAQPDPSPGPDPVVCSDGTPANQCSLTQFNRRCNANGNLVADGSCGCPAGTVRNGNQCVNSCPSNRVLSGLTCVNSCPGNQVVSNGVCVNSCPAGQFNNGGVCVGSCPVGTLINGNQCVNSCPAGTFQNGNTCVNSCPVFSNGNVCVNSCPAPLVQSGNTCVATCPAGQVVSNGVCVNMCPAGQVAVGGTCQLNTPPTIATTTGAVTFTINEGQNLNFGIIVTDPDGQIVTVGAQNLPAGATFTFPTFDWTPSFTQAGTYTVTFTANDGIATSILTVTIIVNDVAAPITSVTSSSTRGPGDLSQLRLRTINTPNGEVVAPGDELMTLVNIKNEGNFEFEDVRVRAFFMDEGLVVASQEFDIPGNHHASRILFFEIPQGMQPGIYYIGFSLSSDGSRSGLRFAEIQVI